MKVRVLVGMLLAAVAVLVPGTPSTASSPGGCPSHYSCSLPMGVGIRAPASWMALPNGKEGPNAIAFGLRGVGGPDYDERLILKLVLIGNNLKDRGLARDEARRLMTQAHARGVIMVAVRYAGSPGFLLRGLPATPSAATRIVLAHRGYVYLLTLPGLILAADQRQALASLRFFQPRGDPVALVNYEPIRCSTGTQRALLAVVSRFSHALIRNDMRTVNHLITPSLRARTRARSFEGVRNPATEQASLSLMLDGPDHDGTPSRPVSFRLLADRVECYGVNPLRATVSLFYRWPGESLNNVSLVRTPKAWLIAGVGLAQA